MTSKGLTKITNVEFDFVPLILHMKFAKKNVFLMLSELLGTLICRPLDLPSHQNRILYSKSYYNRVYENCFVSRIF